jgi:transcription initiation factor TFIIB
MLTRDLDHYMSLEACTRCGSGDLVFDEETGETICLDCGLVMSTNKLSDSVPRMEPSERVSASRNMDRLMTIDKRIRADEEDVYGVRQAVIEIQRFIQALHLPEVIGKSAESIYRRAREQDLVLRGSIPGFAAASVYAACRVHGLPRTLREVSELSSEDFKAVARMYRIIVSELGLSVEVDSPLKHISRIARAVGVSNRAETLASRLMMEIMETGYHVGKSPEGLAASAIYMICSLLGEKCTQKRLSEVADVSTLTIRKRVKDIKGVVDVEKLLGSA